MKIEDNGTYKSLYIGHTAEAKDAMLAATSAPHGARVAYAGLPNQIWQTAVYLPCGLCNVEPSALISIIKLFGKSFHPAADSNIRLRDKSTGCPGTTSISPSHWL